MTGFLPSLRIRFLGLTLAVFLIAGAVTWLAFSRVTDGISRELGVDFAQRQVLYDKARIQMPLTRELALTDKLAHSAFIRDWLLDENDPVKRRQALTELEDFRTVFADHSYFLIADRSLHYYFNDRKNEYADHPLRYTLDPTLSRDAWYFRTRHDNQPYELNVDRDIPLNVTKVWINMRVPGPDGQMLGLVGTGLDLSDFVGHVVRSDVPGVTAMLIGADGSIEAHPDRNLITLDAAGQSAATRHTVYNLLGSDAERGALRETLAELKRTPDSVRTLFVHFAGRPRLLAVSYVPELDWYVISEMDLHVLIGTAPFRVILGVIGLALVVSLLLISAALDRLVLRRLSRLDAATRQIARGDYALRLPPSGNDELGHLSRQFEEMAHTVRDTLSHLEARVEERTAELNAANRVLAQQQEELLASLRYAQMMQSALLPTDAQLGAALGETCVLWAPRDVVGGDFYFMFEAGAALYVGVADCTGHGVPGALMSSAAYAAVRQVLKQPGRAADAPLDQVLIEIDVQLRDNIRHEQAGVDPGMDLGLCRLTHGTGLLEFAGCGIDAYIIEPAAQTAGAAPELRRLASRKRGLGYRARGIAAEIPVHRVALSEGLRVYLPSDGVFDQPGGAHGFGFGRAPFERMLLAQAAQPLGRQAELFEATLREYRGDLALRDDITLLGFSARGFVQREGR
jgi:serine phosphatase RsbU (regulator of sigma subunit)